MQILWWIIWVALDALCNANRKKALNISNLPKPLFKLFSHLIWVFVIIGLVLIFWFEKEILLSVFFTGLVIVAVAVGVAENMMSMHVFKHIKLSDALPYKEIDKLFIIVIGFFLFYGTNGGSSFQTFLITIVTLLVILLFTIDFKSITFPSMIGLLFISKWLNAIKVLIVGYILLSFWSVTYVTMNLVIEMIFVFIIAIVSRSVFTEIFKQSRNFYRYRITGTILGWLWYSLWLYIIQSSGVIIATLLGFLWIVFSILTMKWILDDTPEKKHILLAGIVILLIWIWYSLK